MNEDAGIYEDDWHELGQSDGDSGFVHDGDFESVAASDLDADGVPEIVQCDADASRKSLDRRSLEESSAARPQADISQLRPDAPLGGSLSEPDGVTADSWAEEYSYRNPTGTYTGGTSDRKIDPGTDTAKK